MVGIEETLIAMSDCQLGILLSNYAVVHFDCPTATANKLTAYDTISPPPADDSITEDTLQAAPFGTHLEIVKSVDSLLHEQQLPSPQLLVPTVPSR